MPSCEACAARRNEIEWLRGQVETLQARVLAMANKESALAMSAGEMARLTPTSKPASNYSLPPSVEEACLEMSGGDGKLFGELAAWASSQLTEDGSNAEVVADRIYVGRETIAP